MPKTRMPIGQQFQQSTTPGQIIESDAFNNGKYSTFGVIPNKFLRAIVTPGTGITVGIDDTTASYNSRIKFNGTDPGWFADFYDVMIADTGKGNYTTIQSYLASTPGPNETVYLKRGDYIITTPIVLTQRIIGESPHNTNIIFQGAGSLTINE
jgi:hypothetical protein